MSDTGKAIYSRLTGTPAVAALIGTRVYPEDSPPYQKVYPLTVYECDEETHVVGDDGTYREQVNIATLANTKAAADAVASAIRTALHGQQGTWGGVNVHRALHNRSGDNAKRTQDEQIWIVEQAYTVWVHV